MIMFISYTLHHVMCRYSATLSAFDFGLLKSYNKHLKSQEIKKKGIKVKNPNFEHSGKVSNLRRDSCDVWCKFSQ